MEANSQTIGPPTPEDRKRDQYTDIAAYGSESATAAWIRRAIDAENTSKRLQEAIERHHRQKRGDRCWLDDDLLYCDAGLKEPEREIRCKEEMLIDCKDYIEKRMRKGGDLAAQLSLEELVQQIVDTGKAKLILEKLGGSK